MNALEQHMKERRDHEHARRSAEQIAHAIKEFIPDYCFRDAIERLTEALVKSGAELTSTEQRKRYEALQNTIIEPGKWQI